jgi:hypothetical protein
MERVVKMGECFITLLPGNLQVSMEDLENAPSIRSEFRAPDADGDPAIEQFVIGSTFRALAHFAKTSSTRAVMVIRCLNPSRAGDRREGALFLFYYVNALQAIGYPDFRSRFSLRNWRMARSKILILSVGSDFVLRCDPLALIF